MARMFLAIFMVLVAATAAVAQTSPYPITPYPIGQGKLYKFEKIADGIYYATGVLGGNIPVVIGERDVLIVDDGTTPTSKRDLLVKLRLRGRRGCDE
jgi:hypothetical protein